MSAALSRLCGEPILRVENRRLAVELDPSRRFALNNEAPEYSFAVGESGQLYHLEAPGQGDPGKAPLLPTKATKVDHAAPEAIQRAAEPLGHKRPKKPPQEGEEV
jgi:hypothetical protein